MSILSAVLALLTVPALRVKEDPRDAEIVALKAEIDNLRRDLRQAHEELVRWQNLAVRWQGRYEEALDPEYAARMRALQQAHQLLYAQAQLSHAQMQTQMAQNLGMAYQNAAGQQNAYMFCNCVPARHNLLCG